VTAIAWTTHTFNAVWALGSINLRGIDWLIAGGESGPKFRAADTQWFRDIASRCRDAGVAFFFKQSAGARQGMGKMLDGRIVRNFPTPRRATR
jgi:protein gp37